MARRPNCSTLDEFDVLAHDFDEVVYGRRPPAREDVVRAREEWARSSGPERTPVSRGWKITLTVFGVIVAINVGSRILNSVTGGSPGGPTSSSYATGADGLGAGYLSLLVAEGHHVARLRVYPAKATLAPDETAVVLDPGFVAAADARALRGALVEHGRAPDRRRRRAVGLAARPAATRTGVVGERSHEPPRARARTRALG